jgi:hypothetical protein
MQLFGAEERALMPVGGTTIVATHAIYARLQRLFFILNDAVMLNAALEHLQPDRSFHHDVAGRVLETLFQACEVITDKEFFSVLNHSKALAQFEQHENCLMQHIVNGGHLDSGAFVNLKSVDYFARMRQLKSKGEQKF